MWVKKNTKIISHSKNNFYHNFGVEKGLFNLMGKSRLNSSEQANTKKQKKEATTSEPDEDDSGNTLNGSECETYRRLSPPN